LVMGVIVNQSEYSNDNALTFSLVFSSFQISSWWNNKL